MERSRAHFIGRHASGSLAIAVAKARAIIVQTKCQIGYSRFIVRSDRARLRYWAAGRGKGRPLANPVRGAGMTWGTRKRSHLTQISAS